MVAAAAELRVLLDPAGPEQRLAHGDACSRRSVSWLPCVKLVDFRSRLLLYRRSAKEFEAWLDVRVRGDWVRKKVDVWRWPRRLSACDCEVYAYFLEGRMKSKCTQLRRKKGL